jgi:hypothetical protein
MVSARVWVIDLALIAAAGGAGIVVAAAAVLRSWCCLPMAAPWRREPAPLTGGGRQTSAREELRAHELARRWIWEPRPPLPGGRGGFSVPRGNWSISAGGRSPWTTCP